MGDKEKRPHQNSRQIRKQNDRKYLLMAVFTLVVLGGGLIGLIYGWVGLLTALPFLLLGAALILLPWLVLVGLEKLVEYRERN